MAFSVKHRWHFLVLCQNCRAQVSKLPPPEGCETFCRYGKKGKTLLQLTLLKRLLWETILNSVNTWKNEMKIFMAGSTRLRPVTSEAICNWGTMPARSDGRNFFVVGLPPHFSLVPSTWGGTTIVCYRLRDNWSGEVGRGAKVMGPSTYSYTHTAFLVRPLQEGDGCITSKIIKCSYWTLSTELK